MRVLLIGGGGQLGQELQTSVPGAVSLATPPRDELDLEDEASIGRQLDDVRPDVVINAAAYTAVDQAESESDAAFAVNAQGPQWIAERLQEGRARLIHISTDFVFDGTKASPYLPEDLPKPLGIYGASKLAGERAVLELLPYRALVVRTSWLYSAYRTNFVKSMLLLLGKREEVRVVSDQTGSPTWAVHLATAIWRWALRPTAVGVRHWTDMGVASWYDLAVAVAEEGSALGLLEGATHVVPISTREYPTPAKRPAMSVLDSSASHEELELAPQHWRSSLRQMLTRYRETLNG